MISYPQSEFWGDDTLDGGADEDIINGGEGDDTLIIDSDDTDADGNIDLGEMSDYVTNVEKLDLNDSDEQSVALSANDVIDITDEDNELDIVGGTEDSVESDGSESWSEESPDPDPADEPNDMDTYIPDDGTDATLNLDQDMDEDL